MTIDALLNGLDSVRETGHGKYVACCPAHDDRSPSLSLKDCGDGRILIYCFAGCETEDVLSALGLTFADLMPEKIGTEHRYKPRKWLSARDALEALDHEALVVSIIGADFLQHREIGEETWTRLAVAAERISTTHAQFSPARLKRCAGN